MNLTKTIFLTFILYGQICNAFLNKPQYTISKPLKINSNHVFDEKIQRKDSIKNAMLASAVLLSPVIIAEPANAVEAVSSIPSAFAAYGHYLGLVLVTMSLTAERLLIKPNMSPEDENAVVFADTLYGLAGVLVLITGYLRVTQYGKGWDFYSHEPIFWLKALLFTIMGSSSFFPTIKIVQRAIQTRNANEGKDKMPLPLSEKLAQRMIKIINGELLVTDSNYL